MMLASVAVFFDEDKYNYTTSVSGYMSDNAIKSYFLENFFNVGSYPDEVMRKPIKITIKRGA